MKSKRMGRPPKPVKLKDVGLTVEPETYVAIQQFAVDREWSIAKATRKLVQMGLEALTPHRNGNAINE